MSITKQLVSRNHKRIAGRFLFIHTLWITGTFAHSFLPSGRKLAKKNLPAITNQNHTLSSTESYLGEVGEIDFRPPPVFVGEMGESPLGLAHRARVRFFARPELGAVGHTTDLTAGPSC
jgi:hypothetical protein